MSEIRLRIPAGSSFSAMLDEMPPSLKMMVRDGFHGIAGLDETNQRVVCDAALECLTNPGKSDEIEKQLAQRLRLEEETAKQLLSAGTLLAWIVSSTKEPSEPVIPRIFESIGHEYKEDLSGVAKFEDLLKSQRPRVREALDRTRLEASVLPSLIEFGVAVDVRLGFGKLAADSATESSTPDEVVMAAPVAIIHLDTDATTQEVWFQLTKGELEGVIENLQVALRRIKIAETWSKKDE